MALALADLTPDVRNFLKEGVEQADGTVPNEAVLAAIGVTIAKLRDEAKDDKVSVCGRVAGACWWPPGSLTDAEAFHATEFVAAGGQ